jgi:glycosyltransferase involved in cell wall biosynthesis
VVIPTYNRADLVGRAISSVLSQTHRNLEVIVIDGVLGEVRDPRVRVVRSEARLGVAEARKQGIELSSGRYVAFLDDDEWVPTKVGRQLSAFAGPDPPALVYSGLWIDDGTTRRHGVMDLGDEPFERLLSFPGPVTTSAFMIDRERVDDELWFDPSVATFEDGDLILRISRRWPVALIPEPLYVWHHHGGPRASEPIGQVRARRRIIEKYADDLRARPRAAAHHHFRLAMAEQRIGDRRAARVSLRSAQVSHPSDRRLRVLGTAARLGERPAALCLAAYRYLGRVRRGSDEVWREKRETLSEGVSG